MHAGAGNFPNGIQARKSCMPVAIHQYASHTVMGRRRYGKQVVGKIKTMCTTDSGDSRETSIDMLSGKMTQVKVLAIGLLREHLGQNCASNNITRRKLGRPVIPR